MNARPTELWDRGTDCGNVTGCGGQGGGREAGESRRRQAERLGPAATGRMLPQPGEAEARQPGDADRAEAGLGHRTRRGTPRRPPRGSGGRRRWNSAESAPRPLGGTCGSRRPPGRAGSSRVRWSRGAGRAQRRRRRCRSPARPPASQVNSGAPLTSVNIIPPRGSEVLPNLAAWQQPSQQRKRPGSPPTAATAASVPSRAAAGLGSAGFPPDGPLATDAPPSWKSDVRVSPRRALLLAGAPGAGVL